MAKLEVKDVNKIADLARLSLEGGGKAAENIAKDINNILKLIEQMQQINTDDVKPMGHPFDTDLQFREDEITETDNRSEMQEGAPATEAGLYLVPKVVG